MPYYAACHLSSIALRSRTSHRSELLSQILFGELVEIQELKGKKWVKVRCLIDNTIGWVESAQLTAITHEECEGYNQDFSFVLDSFHSIIADDHHLKIPLGSRLPAFDGLKFDFNKTEYRCSGQVVNAANLKSDRKSLIRIAKRYLNVPHFYGGRTPLGIDSAGLIQMLFLLIGKSMPRFATAQINQGETIDFAERSLPCDIAFFENRFGNISHVGLVLNHNEIIHVDGKVKIDLYDHFGIFDVKKARYTHKLRLIKRLLPKVDNAEKVERRVNEVSINQGMLFENKHNEV